MATSENKPRYGHSPILAISAARRSRMVTNECAPRKMTRPRISTARPIGLLNWDYSTGTTQLGLLNWDYSTLQAFGSVRVGCRLRQQVGRQLRRIAVAASEITGRIDQRFAFLERDHVAAHR